MKYLKIFLSVLGLILFTTGAIVNLVIYIRLKKQGIENVFRYARANPDKLKTAKLWGALGSIGFWLMFSAVY